MPLILADRIEAVYPVTLATMRGQFRVQLQSRFDPEDFVQDAIVDILRSPSQFLDTNTPTTLLVTIARRRMIDQYWHAFGKGRMPRPREYPASPWM